MFNLLLLTFGRRKSLFENPVNFLFANALSLVVLSASIPLVAWRETITYSWFPLWALLLPATAYFAGLCTAKRPVLKSIAALVAVAIFCLNLPCRSVEARFQILMDENANQFATRLAELSRSRGQQLIMGLPFDDFGLTEIGEEIEGLTLNQLLPDYKWTIFEQSANVPIKFFNWLGCHPLTGKIQYPAGWAVKVIEVGDIGPGLETLSFFDSSGPKSVLVEEMLPEGAILLVPFGDFPQGLVKYRGADLFCSSWQSKIARLPQLTVEPLFTVARHLIAYPGKDKYTQGWIALQVKKQVNLSWQIERDRWLEQNASIWLARQTLGRKLILSTSLSLPTSLNVDSGGRTFKIDCLRTKDRFSFAVPIPQHRFARMVLH